MNILLLIVLVVTLVVNGVLYLITAQRLDDAWARNVERERSIRAIEKEIKRLKGQVK